jgi:hypothetical protein
MPPKHSVAFEDSHPFDMPPEVPTRSPQSRELKRIPEAHECDTQLGELKRRAVEFIGDRAGAKDRLRHVLQACTGRISIEEAKELRFNRFWATTATPQERTSTLFSRLITTLDTNEPHNRALAPAILSLLPQRTLLIQPSLQGRDGQQSGFKSFRT